MSTPGTDGVPQHAAPGSTLAQLRAAVQVWVLTVLAPKAKAVTSAVVSAVGAALLPVLFPGPSSVPVFDLATLGRAATGAAAGALLVYFVPNRRPDL